MDGWGGLQIYLVSNLSTVELEVVLWLNWVEIFKERDRSFMFKRVVNKQIDSVKYKVAAPQKIIYF